MKNLSTLLKYEILLSWRQKSRTLSTTTFFFIAIMLFPLVIGPNPELLSLIAPGAILIAALWSGFLNINEVFTADYEHGVILSWFSSDAPLQLYIFLKFLGYWVSLSIPLLIISPLAMLTLNVPTDNMTPIMLALVPITLSMTALGIIGACLTIFSRHKGPLVFLIMIPFLIPILIFGASAMSSFIIRDNDMALYLLWAFSFFLIPITPYVGSAILKGHME